MDNYSIAESLDLLAKLMDIHGENSFKSKSYASAAFTIEKLDTPLEGMSEKKLASIRGIGESVAAKITELLRTGSLTALSDLIQLTPEGVMQMMGVKGLGPKKIHTLWKEHRIDNLNDLEAACREHRLSAIKGFGEKTEAKILEAVHFLRAQSGKYLYIQAEPVAQTVQELLATSFPRHTTALTGDMLRQADVVGSIELLTTAPLPEVQALLQGKDLQATEAGADRLAFTSDGAPALVVHAAQKENWGLRLIQTGSDPSFFTALQPLIPKGTDEETEEGIFRAAGLPLIPAPLREGVEWIERARKGALPRPIEPGDIRGLIHSHSSWSDGAYTIRQMAEDLKQRGFEYLVISDHSRSAFYANGLSVERIREQQKEVDALNRELAPFRIFKSIECDILPDGTLDYSDDVLASFDLVITSIHSNLDMDEEKAMMRLMGAVSNRYTTILGHATGRLLLKRSGYPVNHKALIDACIEQGVAIELNCSPSRMDLDWRWIRYGLDRGLTMSINPDAHALEEFRYLKYGTLVAQKGGMEPEHNLSSFTLSQFEAYLEKVRKQRGLS